MNTKKRVGNAFRYCGGKSRLAMEIHDTIIEIENRLIGKQQSYFEPFSGAMSVGFEFASDVKNGSQRTINVCDFNESIINLWRGLKNGELPPKYVSEIEYNDYKNGNSNMKAFVGSTYSYCASMFGSYRGRLQSTEQTKKSGLSCYNKLMKFVPLLEHVNIMDSSNYETFKPNSMTIYCDPPYNTKNNHTNTFLNNFNHENFWETMRIWSKTNLVFISEVSDNVPDDFQIVWTKTLRRNFNIKNSSKISVVETLSMKK